MRTRLGPAWVVLVLIGAWVGGARAQTPPPDWWMGEPVRAFVADLTLDDGPAHEWLRLVLSGEPGGSAETCAFLTGTGGTPRLDGGLGGLAVWDPDQAPARMAWDLFVLESPPADIVIIDEFDLDRLIPQLARLGGLAGSGPAWRDTVADATIRPFVLPTASPPYALPHGHVVLHHVLALVGNHDVQVKRLVVSHLGPEGDLGRVALEMAVAGSDFVVHLEGIRFAEVATIKAAMDGVERNYGSDAVAITSWGLVDCELSRSYGDLAWSDDAPTSIGAHLMRLIGASRDSERVRTLLDESCRAFRAGIGGVLDCDDAFALALALTMMERQAAVDVGWPFLPDSVDDGSVHDDDRLGRVYASSGNQGLPFPMPPAAWPGVIGVAACGDRDAPDRANYANVGDFLPSEHLMAPGGWFPVADINGNSVGYWGTSFAAPHAALVHTSGDQRRGIPHCNEPVDFPPPPSPN